MKDQEQWESRQEPRRFPMDQLRKETGHDDDEEYAAEIAPPYPAPKQAPVDTQEVPVNASDSPVEINSTHTQARAWIGYTAIVLSVISLFIYPVLLGMVGGLLGLFAYAQGQKALGVWSVIFGVVSLAGYFLLVPLYS